MKSAPKSLNTSIILVLLAVVWAALPLVAQAADGRTGKLPHNAFSKFARDDLLAPLRRQGEVRVIVGLQTPQEVAQPADVDADQIKEQRVLARQSRVLQRLGGHNLRNLKRLRHHHFMAVTVDAAALNA